MSLFRTIIQSLITGILMSALVTIYWSEEFGGMPTDPLEIIAQVGIVSMAGFFISFALALMGRRDK